MEPAWCEGEDEALRDGAVGSLQGRLLLDENQQPRGGRAGVSVPAGHYDHIYATELFSNRSLRPAHDFVMASEHVELARITGPCARCPPTNWWR